MGRRIRMVTLLGALALLPGIALADDHGRRHGQHGAFANKHGWQREHARREWDGKRDSHGKREWHGKHDRRHDHARRDWHGKHDRRDKHDWRHEHARRDWRGEHDRRADAWRWRHDWRPQVRLWRPEPRHYGKLWHHPPAFRHPAPLPVHVILARLGPWGYGPAYRVVLAGPRYFVHVHDRYRRPLVLIVDAFTGHLLQRDYHRW